MSGRPYLTLVNNAAVAALNIVGCLILIPRYGLTGAACSTTASITLVNLVKLAQVRALFGINPFRVETARALVAGLRRRRADGAARAARRLAGPVRRCWRPRRCSCRSTASSSGGRPRAPRSGSCCGCAPSRRSRRSDRPARRRRARPRAARGADRPHLDLPAEGRPRPRRGEDRPAASARTPCTCGRAAPGASASSWSSSAPATGSRSPRASTTWSSAAAASAASPRRRDFHQDGIQVLGGARITFRELKISCGRRDERLINSNLFIKQAGKSRLPPRDVVCESCSFGGWAAHTVSVQTSVRSGVTGSKICVARFPQFTLTVGRRRERPARLGQPRPAVRARASSPSSRARGRSSSASGSSCAASSSASCRDRAWWRRRGERGTRQIRARRRHAQQAQRPLPAHPAPADRRGRAAALRLDPRAGLPRARPAARACCGAGARPSWRRCAPAARTAGGRWCSRSGATAAGSACSASSCERRSRARFRPAVHGVRPDRGRPHARLPAAHSDPLRLP